MNSNGGLHLGQTTEQAKIEALEEICKSFIMVQLREFEIS